MAITLDLSRTERADVKVGISPIAELMATLHVLTESDHHPELSRFVQDVSEGIDADLRLQVQAYSPLWARFRCRLLFPLSDQLDLPLSAELAAIAALPAGNFLMLAAEGVLGIGDGPVPRITDQASADVFLDQCERRSLTRYEMARRLIDNPERFRSELIAFLLACEAGFFGEHWESARPILSRTAEQISRRAESLSVGETVVSLSPTAALLGDGSRVRFDKLQNVTVQVGDGPLLLVPSLRAWPHLTIKYESSFPPAVLFTVENVGYDQLSLRQLNLRLSALNSPLRLEICRHLLGEPISTSELATRLGLSDSQVSRSLRQLRDSGLVVTERDGRYLRHRLATAVLMRFGTDILATITR